MLPYCWLCFLIPAVLVDLCCMYGVYFLALLIAVCMTELGANTKHRCGPLADDLLAHTNIQSCSQVDIIALNVYHQRLVPAVEKWAAWSSYAGERLNSVRGACCSLPACRAAVSSKDAVTAYLLLILQFSHHLQRLFAVQGITVFKRFALKSPLAIIWI